MAFFWLLLSLALACLVWLRRPLLRPLARAFAQLFALAAPDAHNAITAWLRDLQEARKVRRLAASQSLVLANNDFGAHASILDALKFAITANYAEVPHDDLVWLAGVRINVVDVNGVPFVLRGSDILADRAWPIVPRTLRPLLHACLASHDELGRMLAVATQDHMANKTFAAMLRHRLEVFRGQVLLLQGECIRLKFEAWDEALLG